MYRLNVERVSSVRVQACEHEAPSRVADLTSAELIRYYITLCSPRAQTNVEAIVNNDDRDTDISTQFFIELLLDLHARS